MWFLFPRKGSISPFFFALTTICYHPNKSFISGLQASSSHRSPVLVLIITALSYLYLSSIRTWIMYMQHYRPNPARLVKQAESLFVCTAHKSHLSCFRRSERSLAVLFIISSPTRSRITSGSNALEQAAQGGCGCPIPAGIQGQAGCDDPAHSRGLELDDHCGPFQPRPFYHSVIACIWLRYPGWD